MGRVVKKVTTVRRGGKVIKKTTVTRGKSSSTSGGTSSSNKKVSSKNMYTLEVNPIIGTRYSKITSYDPSGKKSTKVVKTGQGSGGSMAKVTPKVTPKKELIIKPTNSLANKIVSSQKGTIGYTGKESLDQRVSVTPSFNITPEKQQVQLQLASGESVKMDLGAKKALVKVEERAKKQEEILEKQQEELGQDYNKYQTEVDALNKKLNDFNKKVANFNKNPTNQSEYNKLIKESSDLEEKYNLLQGKEKTLKSKWDLKEQNGQLVSSKIQSQASRVEQEYKTQEALQQKISPAPVDLTEKPKDFSKGLVSRAKTGAVYGATLGAGTGVIGGATAVPSAIAGGIIGAGSEAAGFTAGSLAKTFPKAKEKAIEVPLRGAVKMAGTQLELGYKFATSPIGKAIRGQEYIDELKNAKQEISKALGKKIEQTSKNVTPEQIDLAVTLTTGLLEGTAAYNVVKATPKKIKTVTMALDLAKKGTPVKQAFNIAEEVADSTLINVNIAKPKFVGKVTDEGIEGKIIYEGIAEATDFSGNGATVGKYGLKTEGKIKISVLDDTVPETIRVQKTKEILNKLKKNISGTAIPIQTKKPKIVLTGKGKNVKAEIKNVFTEVSPEEILKDAAQKQGLKDYVITGTGKVSIVKGSSVFNPVLKNGKLGFKDNVLKDIINYFEQESSQILGTPIKLGSPKATRKPFRFAEITGSPETDIIFKNKQGKFTYPKETVAVGEFQFGEKLEDKGFKLTKYEKEKQFASISLTAKAEKEIQGGVAFREKTLARIIKPKTKISVKPFDLKGRLRYPDVKKAKKPKLQKIDKTIGDKLKSKIEFNKTVSDPSKSLGLKNVSQVKQVSIPDVKKVPLSKGISSTIAAATEEIASLKKTPRLLGPKTLPKQDSAFQSITESIEGSAFDNVQKESQKLTPMQKIEQLRDQAQTFKQVPISANLTIEDQTTKKIGGQREITLGKTIEETIQDQAQQQKQLELTTPKTLTKTLTTPSPTIPPIVEPKITTTPMPDIDLEDIDPNKDVTGGYDVLVKEKGKFVKVNKKNSLDYQSARALMFNALDNTPSATGKLVKKTRKGGVLQNKNKLKLSSKFKKVKGKEEYVEQETYRIDSSGEIKGITVKGWNAPRKVRNGGRSLRSLNVRNL